MTHFQGLKDFSLNEVSQLAMNLTAKVFIAMKFTQVDKFFQRKILLDLEKASTNVKPALRAVFTSMSRINNP